MDFKKLKNKLTGKKPLAEGTGFVKLKNRLLNEAEFPWNKFPTSKGNAELPIGKKGENT